MQPADRAIELPPLRDRAGDSEVDLSVFVWVLMRVFRFDAGAATQRQPFRMHELLKPALTSGSSCFLHEHLSTFFCPPFFCPLFFCLVAETTIKASSTIAGLISDVLVFDQERRPEGCDPD